MATLYMKDYSLGDERRAIVRPVGLSSGWMIAVVADGMNGTHTLAPDTAIPADVNTIVTNSMATLAKLRLVYDDGDTPSTDPVVNVFGRCGSSDTWMALVNNSGLRDITMTTAVATDIDNGTEKSTTVDNDDHIVDLKGCDQIVVLVKTAYAVSAGDASLAWLEIGLF